MAGHNATIFAVPSQLSAFRVACHAILSRLRGHGRLKEAVVRGHVIYMVPFVRATCGMKCELSVSLVSGEGR